MSSNKMKTEDFLPLSPELLLYSQRIGRACEDPHLQKLAKFAASHEHAKMNSALDQVAFIQLLVRLMNVKTFVEVGVFLGYTTLAVAQALPPDGRVIGLELMQEFTDLAEPFWKDAGVREKIDLRIGPALESLKKIEGPVDLIYVDCDKPNYSNYVVEALRIVRAGGLVLVDNTLWSGKVIDKSNVEENTLAIRAVNELIAALSPKDYKIVNLPIGDGLTMIHKLIQ